MLGLCGRVTVGSSLTLGDLQSFLTTKWQLRDRGKSDEGGGGGGEGGGGGGEGEGGYLQPLTLYHYHGRELSLAGQSSNSSVGCNITTADPASRCVCPKHSKTALQGSLELKDVQLTNDGDLYKQATEQEGNSAREQLVVQQSRGQETSEVSTYTCMVPSSSTTTSLTSGHSDTSTTGPTQTGQGTQQCAVVHRTPDLLNQDSTSDNPPSKLDMSLDTTLSSIHTMVQ